MSQQRTYEPVTRENDGPLVFYVQNQHRWDRDTEKFVPKYDLDPARVFGDLVPLLSPTASPFSFESILDELQFKLAHFRDGDYLLLVGNPVLIGASVAVASSVNEGHVSVLQWSGKDRSYVPVHLEGLLAN